MRNNFELFLLLNLLITVSVWNARAQAPDDVMKSLAQEEQKLGSPTTPPPNPAPAPTTAVPGPNPAPATTAKTAAPTTEKSDSVSSNTNVNKDLDKDKDKTVPQSAVGTAGTAAVAPAPTSFLEKFEYSLENRRDPFAPYVLDGMTVARRMVNLDPKTPLEKYELEELKLSAILWNVTKPKAMVRDPQGASHIVLPNQRIGRNNGYVAAIREGEIVVVEPLQEEGRVVFSTKLMRIQND